MGKIIAIANQKGGVGKTTTAINLSSALSHLSKKTLLIDLDPQGNAGRGLGIDISTAKNTIYEALTGAASINDCIFETVFHGLSIVPANLRLASLEASMYAHPREKPFVLLGSVLQLIKGQFDYILLDCPPSLGLLNLNALASADSVLIPVQCEYFAMEAIAAILASISNVQNDLNPALKIEGFLLTMVDARTELSEEIQKEVRKLFRENTFTTVIPRNQSVSESQARQLPVTDFRPTSQGSFAYFALAKEILDHEQH